MIDLEFMKRAEEFAAPLKEEYSKKRIRDCARWRENNKESLRISQKKYRQSENVRKRLKERAQMRYRAFIELSSEEKDQFKIFYKNRPKGYTVDHIIPLTKGGSSRLENLQYLTLQQNSSKKDRDCYNKEYVK